MRSELMGRLGVAGLLLVGVLAGCHGPAATCGPGTVLSGGACVPDGDVTTCGDGTSWVDGVCLGTAPADTAADASDVASATDALADAADGAGDVTATGAVGCQPACKPGFACFQGVCLAQGPPDGWTCAASTYADSATCNCGCGGVDPDCNNTGAPVVGCPGAKACNADGTCPPCQADCVGKTCGDNGCGGVCGECLDPTEPICAAGKCSPCIPNCAGLACGGDGCGGSCGSCPNDKLCSLGVCVAPALEASCVGYCGKVAPSGCACTAECAAKGTCCIDVDVCGCIAACDGKSCGDDGCGGTCGACGNGEICASGQCKFPSCSPLTCHGHGTCNPSTVTCACEPGYTGAYCDQCPTGMVGFPNCTTPCTDISACGDGNACTDDLCDLAAGCQHLPNAATCTDGDICTATACFGGACAILSITSCDDTNACTSDYCDPSSGCAHLPSGATACEDDKPCLGGDVCNGAVCVGGSTPVNCADGNTCTDDSCDPAIGCVNAGNGGSCDLGDGCSAGAVCSGTSCKSLGPKNCDDGNPCTNDFCASPSGACQSSAAAAGKPCDDGQACSKNDACDGSGGCASGTVVCKLPSISGLIAHFSTASLATLVAGSDKGVATWLDQSGNGNDLNAVDPASLPVLTDTAVNGARGVRFGGSAGLVSAAFGSGGTASVFAVVCTDAKAAPGVIAAQGSGGWQLATAVTPATVSFDVGASGLNSGQTVPVGACAIIAARVDAAARSLDLIQSTTQSASANGVTLASQSAQLFLGTNATGASGGSILSEFLLFDHAVSDVERDAITSYLRAAWNFALPKPDFAWYDAADLATVVTAASDAALVTTWGDKSDFGRNATVGSGDSPQLYLNGTPGGGPAIRFNGSQVRLCTQPVQSSPNITIFTVFELDVAQANSTLLAQGDGAFFAVHIAPAAPQTLAWQVAANDGAALPLGAQQWQLLTVVQDNTNAQLYDLNDNNSTTQAPIPAGQAPICLGNSLGGNASAGGWVAEIRAYASALTATDRRFIEDSLRAKFGL